MCTIAIHIQYAPKSYDQCDKSEVRTITFFIMSFKFIYSLQKILQNRRRAFYLRDKTIALHFLFSSALAFYSTIVQFFFVFFSSVIVFPLITIFFFLIAACFYRLSHCFHSMLQLIISF